MSKHHARNKNNTQSGFTILVAVVTAGVLLIVAMSIGGIALKEQVLSSANKESQIAFYAADTGMECAMYLDQKLGIFKTDANNNSTLGPGDFESLSCNGSSLGEVNGSAGPSATAPSGHAKYTFSFRVSDIPVGTIVGGVPERTTCAIVKITKNTNDPHYPEQERAKTHTTISSWGYNTCDASLNRINRAIEMTN